jgi:hypothetical protein
MFGRREEVREWLSEIVQKFRQKGAVSPDKAMTAEELGLPLMFQEMMKRRLGRSGIFVEVNGKYYLEEGRLNEIRERRQSEEAAWGSRNRMFTLRIVRMVIVVLSILLLFWSILVESWELRVIAASLMVVWLAVTILQGYYVSKARRRLQAF